MPSKKETTPTPPVEDERQADGGQNPAATPENPDAPVRATEDASDRVDEAEMEFVPQHVVDGGRDYRVADDDGNPQDVSGYIGVDPEYMTYADVTQKPLLTQQERFEYTNQYDHLVGNADEDVTAANEDVASGDVSPESEAPSVVDEGSKDEDDDEFGFVK